MEAILEEVQVEKYAAYKDSGVEWLGEIPEHWELLKSKYLWKEKIQLSEAGKETLLSVSQYLGVNNREVDSRSESLIGYKKVSENDLVINIMLAWLGGLGLSPLNGVVSPAYGVYELLGDADPKFLHYLYRTETYLDEFARRSRGVVPSRWRMYTDDFGQVLTLLPPKNEQTKIARFLDQKNADIEKAIGIKERQIELLKERRQILIHQAVTRGLNPNAPLKDSGVEWIGQIPAHWEVKRVKYCTTKISKGTTPSTEGRSILEEGPIRYIKAENIQEGFITDSPAHFIDEKTNDLIKRSELKANDVLFVIAGATLGKIAIVSNKEVPSNTNQAVAFLRPNFEIIPEYLSTWLTSSLIQELIWLEAVQSAQPNLSMTSLGNFPIFLPDLEEQKEIQYYVEMVSNKISTAISCKEKEIEKLKEYKATLINSAVTGKIKVC